MHDNDNYDNDLAIKIAQLFIQNRQAKNHLTEVFLYKNMYLSTKNHSHKTFNVPDWFQEKRILIHVYLIFSNP